MATALLKFKGNKRLISWIEIHVIQLTSQVFSWVGLLNQRVGTTWCSFFDDLAKLNLKCHMNYS